MKRYAPIFLLLTLMLSACTIRLDVGVEVNEDESGSFAFFMGFDEDFKNLVAEGGGEDFDLTEDLSDVPPGWEVEDVTEDGFEGVRISAPFTSFEDLDKRILELGEGAGGGVGTDFLTDFGLTHEGDEFRFSVDVTGLDEELAGSLGDAGGGEDLFSGLDPSTFIGDLFEIRFKLTLPGTIGENNADSVDGNTLLWNVGLADDGGTYSAVSSTGGGSSTLIYGAVAVAALVVVGVGATAVSRRKKDAAEEAVNSTPMSMEAPPVDPIN